MNNIFESSKVYILIRFQQAVSLYEIYSKIFQSKLVLVSKMYVEILWRWENVTESEILVEALTFQTSLEVTKRLRYITLLFLGNDTKTWFLINWKRDNNTQGVHEHTNFGKASLFVE